eukprot:1291845-Amphidinium_carterae.1
MTVGTITSCGFDVLPAIPGSCPPATRETIKIVLVVLKSYRSENGIESGCPDLKDVQSPI